MATMNTGHRYDPDKDPTNEGVPNVAAPRKRPPPLSEDERARRSLWQVINKWWRP